MKGRPPEDPVVRFWRRVKKTRTCWLFEGTTSRGYAQFWCYDEDDNYVHTYAHVFSFELHKGRLPKGKQVCHTCDVRNCVRPSHLWAGTQKENIADAVSKGRFKGGPKGKQNGMFGRVSSGFSGRKHTIQSRKKMSLSRTGKKRHAA